MKSSIAKGKAFLKTGTLTDTRALAGYVQARSGKTYAVAAIINDPHAGKGVAALDAFIAWIVDNG
jgi:D-alanyl-D-alanine carboxypeptidase/D-alanyl-D-alanine-endopeptidase (penicillin-binding protein 4)